MQVSYVLLANGATKSHRFSPLLGVECVAKDRRDVVEARVAFGSDFRDV